MAFGRFGHRAATRPMGDINITPLVDVMLVLVVVFILTAPLLASSIRLELPSAGTGAAGDAAGPAVTVVINAAGQLSVDDQPLDTAGFATRLAQVGQAQPGTESRLRADRTVPYGRVVEVMDVARAAGLNRIGFVTDPAPLAATAPAAPSAEAPKLPGGATFGPTPLPR